jgi:hypothetical protein
MKILKKKNPKGKLHFLEEISNFLLDKNLLLSIHGGISKTSELVKYYKQNNRM